MDKLKPILEQKFWILSVLCLILPLTGWWMSTSAMSSEFNTRKTAIDGAFSGIPAPGPNKNWTAKAKAFNVEEEQKLNETGEHLLGQTESLRTWPEKVREEVEKVGFEGEIPSKPRSDYRYVYQKEREDTTAILKPFDPYTGTGLVDADPSLVPNLEWELSETSPPSREMWNTQEDIWLFRALYQAIANINTPPGGNPSLTSSSIVDAKIKQIKWIELRGGGPKTAGGVAGSAPAGGAGGAAGAAAMPGGPGGPAMAGPPAMGGAGMYGMANAGGAGSGGVNPATFDPTEQFGSDEDASAAAAGGAAAAGPAGPAGPGGAAGAGAEKGGPMGMMGGMASNVPRKRYIEENAKYRTRGFYMEVVMDHRYLPEFLSELSDSPWPLRVVRVQMVDRDTSDVGGDTVGSYGAPGAMAGMGGRGGAGGPMGGRGGSPMGAMGSRGMTGMRSGPGMSMPKSRDKDDDGPRGIGAGARGAAAPRMTPGTGGDFGGVAGEGAVTVEAALADPFLVDVAIAGIFTIYLPEKLKTDAAGASGTPGATTGTPTPADTAPATATTPTAPVTGAATTGAAPAATTTTPATDAAATPDNKAAAPAEATPPPAATTPDATKPAETKPAAEGTPVPTTPPPAGSPPATNPPADKPAEPGAPAEKSS